MLLKTIFRLRDLIKYLSNEILGLWNLFDTVRHVNWQGAGLAAPWSWSVLKRWQEYCTKVSNKWREKLFPLDAFDPQFKNEEVFQQEILQGQVFAVRGWWWEGRAFPMCRSLPPFAESCRFCKYRWTCSCTFRETLLCYLNSVFVIEKLPLLTEEGVSSLGITPQLRYCSQLTGGGWQECGCQICHGTFGLRIEKKQWSNKPLLKVVQCKQRCRAGQSVYFSAWIYPKIIVNNKKGEEQQ